MTTHIQKFKIETNKELVTSFIYSCAVKSSAEKQPNMEGDIKRYIVECMS